MQLRCLWLTARGYCRKEIAQKLNISPKTVAVHMLRAQAKYGAVSDLHLAVISLSTGLVDYTKLIVRPPVRPEIKFVNE